MCFWEVLKSLKKSIKNSSYVLPLILLSNVGKGITPTKPDTGPSNESFTVCCYSNEVTNEVDNL